MEETNTLDIWRIKHPRERRYTWRSNTKPPIMCRLDMFLVSESLAGLYIDSDIVPGFKSDHSCTTLTIDGKEESKGKGFWKFNSSLLRDEGFKNEIKKSIAETIEYNKDSDKCLLWDTLECRIRGTCISYSAKLNREKKCMITSYNTKLKVLETELCEAIQRNEPEQKIQDIDDRIKICNRALEDKVEEETRAAAIRSRYDWYEAGDTCNKMFLNLEKNKSIPEVHL